MIRNLLAKSICVVLALTTTLSLFNPRGGGHVLFWTPKLLVAALSPFLVLANSLFLIVGLQRRDAFIAAVSALGALAGIRHVAKAIKPRDRALDRVFGADWEAEMPLPIHRHLKPRRWQLICHPPRLGPITRNVLYGGNPTTGQALFADIQEPSGNIHSGLALIFIHGGAWRYGEKNIEKFPYFRRLSQQGHLIMDIDYSLTEATSLADMVTDVKRAVLWLKENAEHYHLEPNHIVLVGQSAGGHLALMAAYTPNDPAFQPPELEGDTSVRGVVSYYGPTDMTLLHHDLFARFGLAIDHQFSHQIKHEMQQRDLNMRGVSLADGVAGLMGGAPDQIPEIYDLLSPITHAGPTSPPTLLFHGEHDFLVSPEQSRLLHEKLQKIGAKSILLTFDGCDHSYESIFPRFSPAAQASSYYLERFLALMLR